MWLENPLFEWMCFFAKSIAPLLDLMSGFSSKPGVFFFGFLPELPEGRLLVHIGLGYPGIRWEMMCSFFWGCWVYLHRIQHPEITYLEYMDISVYIYLCIQIGDFDLQDWPNKKELPVVTWNISVERNTMDHRLWGDMFMQQWNIDPKNPLFRGISKVKYQSRSLWKITIFTR